MELKQFIENAKQEVITSGQTPDEIEITINLSPNGKFASYGDFFVAQARFIVPMPQGERYEISGDEDEPKAKRATAKEK